MYDEYDIDFGQGSGTQTTTFKALNGLIWNSMAIREGGGLSGANCYSPNVSDYVWCVGDISGYSSKYGSFEYVYPSSLPILLSLYYFQGYQWLHTSTPFQSFPSASKRTYWCCHYACPFLALTAQEYMEISHGKNT
jgi:hypothetical protein